MFQELETENLILKSINHDDDSFVLELFSNDLLTQYLGSFPIIKNNKDAIKFVNGYLETDSKIKHLYVISLKSNNEKIGIVYLAHLDTLTSTIELNCSIRPSLWNKGYASEAVNRVLQFVKENLTMNLVYIYLDPNNIPGVRLAQKLGFYKSKEQRYVKASRVKTLHDIYYQPLFTRNSYQREFLNEGADVSDNYLVKAAKEEFKKNPTVENNIKVVDLLYKQFKHHDALSYIKENENNEDLLYKKALICMKINRLEESNQILEYLFNSFKRIKYCYKLMLTYYYLGEYKKAYDLLLEWYDLFDKDDMKIAALFWIMACSIKLGYDKSVVKKLFFKYEGELKTGYFLAIKQYLFDNVKVDIDEMNDVDRATIYYAASLFDKENSSKFIESVLDCINPWGSSCFLAALYNK